MSDSGPLRPRGASSDVGWEGAVNARRLLGDVYRMGRREWLTERGWRQAYDDGVRTVIDLRNPAERLRRPTDPQVADAALSGIEVLFAPTEDEGNEEFAALAVPYVNHPRYYAANLRFFPHRIAGVFRAIAEAEGGVVVHCSAGRDRTGLIASMLLQLAGHGPSAGDHYDAAARGINAWHGVSPVKHPHERHLADADLAEYIGERRAALEEFMAGLDTEAFLLENGVSGAQIAAVRAKLGVRTGPD